MKEKFKMKNKHAGQTGMVVGNEEGGERKTQQISPVLTRTVALFRNGEYGWKSIWGEYKSDYFPLCLVNLGGL